MKVLLITNDPTILDLGSSGHARMRANALAIGELHVLIATKENQSRDEGSVRIHTVQTGRFFKDARMRAAGHSLIKDCAIQALWAEDPFELGSLAQELARATGLPYYVNIHTDFLSPWYGSRTGMFRSSQVSVPRGNRKRIALAKKVLPEAKGIRVPSERLKTSLVTAYGDSIPMPVVIPIAVQTAPTQKVSFPFTFPFTVIVAGRLDAGRRVVDVIDAIAQIRERYPGVGLFVVGDGPERAALEKHAKRKKLSDRVIFLGDRRDTRGLIQSANAFVQASAHEGYGRRILQAALARVPIITTDVGIVGEVLKGYEDVLAMPPGDPSAIATHLMGLMEDVSTRNLLTMNAEARAKEFIRAAGDISARIAAFLRGETSQETVPAASATISA